VLVASVLRSTVDGNALAEREQPPAADAAVVFAPRPVVRVRVRSPGE
jgi:hypothetical protein